MHLSGRTIDLWIGTDFPDAFNVHMISGKSGEMIAKRNYFGWYVIRLFAGPVNQQSARISSVDFGTVSMLEDMKKLLTEDLMGVRPTELCTCRDLQTTTTTLLNRFWSPRKLSTEGYKFECLEEKITPK